MCRLNFVNVCEKDHERWLKVCTVANRYAHTIKREDLREKQYSYVKPEYPNQGEGEKEENINID